MSRRFEVVIIMSLLSLASSAKVYIPLVKSVPSSTGNNGNARTEVRTSTHSPLAYYESDTLYVQYSAKTVSSVIINSDSTDLAIISEIFDYESTAVQIPIGRLAVNGSYTISINAFGVWWVGYFDYMEVTPIQSIRKGFSAVVDDPMERNYGIFSVVGNATSGWNYGVSGMLYGQNDGTGIYGSSRYDEGFNTGGRFAGLFHGDIKTTDAVYASVYNTLADSRLNEDMIELETGSVDNIMQMSVYKYGLKQYYVDNGDGTSSLGYYNDDSDILGKDHFGLSGQEIREIYPDLVSENQEGFLSINYVEMIPLLIQSIKELRMELDNTNAELESLKTGTKVATRIQNMTSALYQNTPNPFKERCVVKCTVPQNVVNAVFYLYDYSGHQIQSRIIKDRDDVQIVFEADGLEAGIYLYSLVCDGELVDTRRMILIE